MEVNVRYTSGAAFVASARGHEVACDQPRENAGEDTGMTPPEFMLASLGTCAGYYALQYLKARKLPEEGLSVRVEAEKATGPARLGRFLIEVKVGNLEARHEEGLMRAVKACLIHNTLHTAPEVKTVIQMAGAEVEDATLKV